MTGFRSKPWVCPSDTQKLGFYIRSSSHPVRSLSLCLSLRLSTFNGYTCSLCFYLNGEHVSLLSLQQEDM